MRINARINERSGEEHEERKQTEDVDIFSRFLMTETDESDDK